MRLRYRIHCMVLAVRDNRAFWSITVYGADGYMKSANSFLNSSTAKLNADGTFTTYFGSEKSCGDVANRLDVTDGWNFLMRTRAGARAWVAWRWVGKRRSVNPSARSSAHLRALRHMHC